MANKIKTLNVNNTDYQFWAAGLFREPDSISAANVNSFNDGSHLRFAKFSDIGIPGMASNDGLMLSIPWSGNYCSQIAVDDTSSNLAIRGNSNGTWGKWQQMATQTWVEAQSYATTSQIPTVPSVGDGTLTIKQNGTVKGTFKANQGGNTTIELTDANTTYSIGNGRFTVEGTDGLTGSGSNTANSFSAETATLKHAVPSGASAGVKSGNSYIKTITTDKFGHITGYTTGVDADTNSAHTHSAGVGLAQEGSGGTNGNVKYTLKTSTASEIGGGKAVYYNGTMPSGKYYGVQIDKNGKYFVGVPWDTNTDTNTAHSHACGDGLTMSGSGGISGTVTYGINWNKVAKKEHDHDERYLKLSGGTLTGNLTISHAATKDMSAGSANPKITFSENGSQPVHIIYTDYDDYRSPAGLKVIGGSSASPAWFEVEGSIYSNGHKVATENQIPTIPTIPVVNNGTLTIKQNGTVKGTFKANQSGNTTVELADTNNTYSIGNGTLTIKQNGTVKGTFKANQSGNTTVELVDTDTDTDTWRPITTSWNGSATETSISQSAAKNLYDTLVNGYASSAGVSSKVYDINGSTPITFAYSSGGRATPDYYAVWNGYQITYASTAQVKAHLGGGCYTTKPGSPKEGDLYFTGEYLQCYKGGSWYNVGAVWK